MIKKINNFIISTEDLPSGTTNRYFTVLGDDDAVFSIYITNEDTHYYNFKTRTFTSTYSRLENAKITNGKYNDYIKFPAVTDNDEYNIFIQAEPHFNTELNIPGVNEKILHKVENNKNDELLTSSIYQFLDTQITFSLASPASSGSYNTLPSNVSISKPRNTSYTQTRAEYGGNTTSGDVLKSESTKVDIDFNVTLSTSQFVIARQPLITDFEVTIVKTVNGAVNSTLVVFDDVDKIRVGQAVSGSGVPSSTTVSSINTDTKTLTMGKTCNVADGASITFTDTGSDGAGQIFGSRFLIDDISLTIEPVVTTLDAGASNSRTIPLTSTDGIKAAETVLMTGVGVTCTSPHVDTVNSGVSVVVSTNQTIENGQTVTFTGSSRSATIKATIYISSFGEESFTTTLNLDNILTVA